jgi:hypothetical protein
LRLVLVAGILLLVQGCATWNGEKGVENNWRNPETASWEIGKATDADVTGALGPPSQIISLSDQVVFYYMEEQSRGRAYIFILWNQSNETVRYDRAIFFFDKQGVLEKYAYSPEAFTYDGTP